MLLFLFGSLSSQSQQRTMVGDKYLSIYSGFVNPEPFTFSIFSFSGQGNATPSFNSHFQYAVSNRFLIGPFMSYYRVRGTYVNSVEEIISAFDSGEVSEIFSGLDCLFLGNCGETTVEERVSILTFGLKMAYIKNISQDFETYLSMHLGYSLNQRSTITENLFDEVSDFLSLNIGIPRFVYFSSAGVRYFISDKFSAFGEIGYGNSHLISFGMTVNFSY